MRMRLPPLVLMTLLSPLSMTAQPASPAPTPALEYAVKMVCGAPERTMASGRYFTVVNVHNPVNRVGFRVKFVPAPTMRPGQPTPFEQLGLGNDEALSISCNEATRRSAGFTDGFAVIQSDTELDVVAVYTAAGGNGGVSTMHIERVAARRLGGGTTCPDLVVDSIFRPTFANNVFSIVSVIRNIGAAPVTVATTARIEDPPFSNVQTVPPLAPGGTATVTFTLPAGVFDPDLNVEVTADAGGAVQECREDNNRRRLSIRG